VTATEGDSAGGCATASELRHHEPESQTLPGAAARAWPGLEPATAALAGWALQAVLAVALCLGTRELPSRGLGLRLYHLAYEASHLLALGALCFWVVAGWLRWGPRRAHWSVVAVGAASWVVALATTGDDVAGWMARHGVKALFVFPALALVPAAAVTLTMLAVVWARTRFWLRLVALAVALALSLANHRVLLYDYAGMHLFWAWIAALLTTAFARASGQRSVPARPARLALAAGCTVVGLLSLTVIPPRAVRSQLLLSSGAVVAPFVTQLWPSQDSVPHPLPIQASPWFSDRSDAPARPPSPPLGLPKDKIVIVATIEALRADVVADDRYRKLVPELHRLKAESVYFTMARAPSPATATTLTALFTGKYYSSVYWTKQGATVTPRRDQTPRLPELLESSGVHTGIVNALWGRKPSRGGEESRGFGFARKLHTERKFGSAREVIDLLTGELAREPDGPQFLYLHFLDSHAPYRPPHEGGTPFDGYLSKLSRVDGELRRLRHFLKRRGLENRTILIVSADHGEAFGEHGYHYHAYCLYEEVLRIPLIINGPGITHGTVNVPVTLIDVMPTILDLFGLQTPGYVMGESLVPFLRGHTPELTRPIAVDSGRRMEALYFPNGYKVMTDLKRKSVEVYDLRTDPEERHDLTDENPEVDRYIAAQRAFFKAHTLRVPGWEPPWRKF
jgi:arylsulfatase A-like enzyme